MGHGLRFSDLLCDSSFSAQAVPGFFFRYRMTSAPGLKSEAKSGSTISCLRDYRPA